MNILSNIRKKIAVIVSAGILHVFSANVINKIVVMLSNMVITRIMSVYSYGIYAYVINIYSYIQVINAFGLLTGAFQYGAKNHRNGNDLPYYKYCVRVGLLIDSILIFVVIGLMQFYQPKVEGSKLFIQLYIPLLVLEFLFNLLITILRCSEKISEYSKMLNYNTFLIAIGTCIGSLGGLFGIIIGRYLGYTLSIVMSALCQKDEINKIRKSGSISKLQRIDLWRYSIFAGISSGITTIVYLLDVTMIVHLVNNVEQVAYYKIATLIPTALSFIPLSVITAVMPKIVKNANDSQWLKRTIKGIIGCLVCFNLIFCIILFALAPFIITVVSGEKYLGAVPYFRILIIGYFFNGSFRAICINILSALEKVRMVLLINVISGVSDIVLNYVLITKYGTIGASYATCSTVMIISVLSFGYLVHVVKRKRYCLKI